MNDREKWRERESGVSVQAARDDDIYIYIYIYIQKNLKLHIHTYLEKNDYKWIPKPLQHTHTQRIKYQKQMRGKVG